MTFALVMPTLNEIEGLRYVLPKIDRSLFKEIIVVDGHSTDGTPEFCREQGLTVVFQPKTGIPDAEEAGFKHVTADAMILFTPDGNSLAEVLPPICDKLSEGYDIVVASRYCGGAQSEDDDFLTALGNRLFTATVNLLFRARFTDVLVGFRAYTCDAVRRMQLPDMTGECWFRREFRLVNSWELAASIRAARLKLKVAEIPADEPKRIGGVRKLSIIRNGCGGVSQIVYDFFLFRPTKPLPPARAGSAPK